MSSKKSKNKKNLKRRKKTSHKTKYNSLKAALRIQQTALDLFEESLKKTNNQIQKVIDFERNRYDAADQILKKMDSFTGKIALTILKSFLGKGFTGGVKEGKSILLLIKIEALKKITMLQNILDYKSYDVGLQDAEDGVWALVRSVAQSFSIVEFENDKTELPEMKKEELTDTDSEK